MNDTAFLFEKSSLAELQERHMAALRVTGEVAARFQIVENDGLRLRDEDESAMAAAMEAEMLALNAIVNYRPSDKKEAIDKVTYMAALIVARRDALDETTLSDFMASLSHF